MSPDILDIAMAGFQAGDHLFRLNVNTQQR
jgi:hypothetical protein